MSAPRTATKERRTSESQVRVALNLDGTGESTISTGVGFYDHMLTALAKHSLVRNLRKVLPYVYKISGVLLVLAGLYVAYYGWYELRVRNSDTSAGGAAQLVTDWSASISTWVQQIGPVRLGIVLAAAVGVVVALTMGTRRRPEP